MRSRALAVMVVVAAVLGLVGCATKSLDVEARGPATTAVEPSSGSTSEDDAQRAPFTSSTTTSSTAPSLVPDAMPDPIAPSGPCPDPAELDALGFDARAEPTADQLAVFLDLVASYLPPELLADLEVMRAPLVELFAALEAVGGLDDESYEFWNDPRVAAAFEALTDPAVEAAGTRIDEYLAAQCPSLSDFGSDEEWDPVGEAIN